MDAARFGKLTLNRIDRKKRVAVHPDCDPFFMLRQLEPMGSFDVKKSALPLIGGAGRDTQQAVRLWSAGSARCAAIVEFTQQHLKLAWQRTFGHAVINLTKALAHTRLPRDQGIQR